MEKEQILLNKEETEQLTKETNIAFYNEEQLFDSFLMEFSNTELYTLVKDMSLHNKDFLQEIKDNPYVYQVMIENQLVFAYDPELELEERQFPTIPLPKEKEPNVKQVVMSMGDTALLELKNNPNMPYVIASGMNTIDTSKFIEWHSGRYYIDKSMAEQDMIKDMVENTLANENVSEHEMERIIDKIFDLTTDMDFQDYGTKDEIYEEIQETLTYGTNEQRQEIFNEVYSHMDLSDKEQSFDIMLTLQRMQMYCENADKKRDLEAFNYLETVEMSLESDYGMIDGIINNVDYQEEPKGLEYIKSKGTYSSQDTTQEEAEKTKNMERER